MNRLLRWRPPSMPRVDGVRVRDVRVPSADGHSIRVRLYSPEDSSRPSPALLWMHGGGFVTGIPEQDEPHSIELCQRLGYVVAAVDYRLATEAAFPKPLEDCYAALEWLYRNAGALNVAPTKIAVGGNSAGGGLAAGLALLAHDRHDIPLSFQLLIYPMLDDRTVLRTDIDERNLRLWSAASNTFGWSTYLGRQPGHEQVSPYAAPARRRDLSGLPPCWIGIGTLDLFHEEALQFGARLSEAGVACELYVVPGAFHGFELAGLGKRVVRDFRQSYLRALARSHT
jgi:acetyl esterase/lipase